MPVKRAITLAIVMLIGSVFSAGQAPTQSGNEVFPMRKGTRWTYRGQVSWETNDGTVSQTRKKQLEWSMTVVDSVARGKYKAAVLIGHPSDLNWYEEGRKPDCHLLIAEDESKFYLTSCIPTASAENLSATEGDLAGLIDEERLIFKLPLKQGDMFGGDTERKDGMYAWVVESVEQKTTRLFPRAPRGAHTEYTLAYRTNPDHQIATYVPGIGLVSYLYSHHGTVSDTDVTLVSFQP